MLILPMFLAAFAAACSKAQLLVLGILMIWPVQELAGLERDFLLLSSEFYSYVLCPENLWYVNRLLFLDLKFDILVFQKFHWIISAVFIFRLCSTGIGQMFQITSRQFQWQSGSPALKITQVFSLNNFGAICPLQFLLLFKSRALFLVTVYSAVVIYC